MIAVQKPNTVKSSGIQSSVSFGIKQEGLAHIFNVLRNQLYSDKILAVIREYSCNAVDANVEAGVPDEPITVTLPNRLEPMFKVRDNGLGLSDKDIQEIYAFYGESTKRNSNKLIGQLGLGSKSAFAYGDNYVINSFVDGVKTSYNAFIDASQIGQISKLFSIATTEPNGVEIVIPVRDRDVDSFKEKAENLFQDFKVRPIVKGQTLEYDNREVIFSGDCWSIAKADSYSGRNPVAVMGNIGYDIDLYAINSDNETLQKVKNNGNLKGLKINFEIGELEVSASRESLQYTDRTQKALIAKLEKVVAGIIVEYSKLISNCPSYIEAKKLNGDMNDYYGNYYRFSSLVKGNVTYKGVVVAGNDVTFGQTDWKPDDNVRVAHYKKSRSGTRIVKEVPHSCSVNMNTVFVLNDEERKTKIAERVYDMIHSKKKVYVLAFANKTAQDTWMKREGFVDADFIKLSSLTPTTVVVPKNASTGTTIKSSKHSEKAFTFTDGVRHYSSTCSNYWTGASVDVAKDSGVYVSIEGFQFERNGGYHHPSSLNNVVKAFTSLGITIPTIYGFKKDVIAKVKNSKNWTNLWTYLNKAMSDHLTTKKMIQDFVDKKAQLEVKNNNSIAHILKKVNQKDVKSSGVFGKFVKAYMTCRNDAHSDTLEKFIATAENYDLKVTSLEPTFNLGDMAAEVLKTYPMLNVCDTYDIKAPTLITEYVNLIDKTS